MKRPLLALAFLLPAALSSQALAKDDDHYLWYEHSPWHDEMLAEDLGDKKPAGPLVTVDLASCNPLFKSIVPEGLDLFADPAALRPLAEKFFPKGRPFTFVTAHGSFTLPVAAVTDGPGASEHHVYAHFSAASSDDRVYHPKDAALVCVPAKGSATPARLRQLQPIVPSGEFQDGVLAAIDTKGIVRWDEKTNKEKKVTLREIGYKTHFEGEPLKFDEVFSFEKHVRVYLGSFPLGATRLVIVNIPTDVEPGHYVSCAFLVGEKGTPVHYLQEPVNSIERFDLLWTVDLDGDGLLELIAEDSYYEGAYTVLLRWDGKEFTRTMLTGDGA